MSIACPVTSALALLTLAIPFALRAEIVAEHGSKDEVFFGRELVQRTGDNESDSLQTFAPSEINVQVLLSCGLQQVRNTLTFQSLYGQFTVLLVAGE